LYSGGTGKEKLQSIFGLWKLIPYKMRYV